MLDPSTRERILFVCTANVDRSRTAEDLYRDDTRYEVRSAGVAPFATVVVTRDLLQTMIGHGLADQDFATLVLMQAKASGIDLKPENVEVGDGLSS